MTFTEAAVEVLRREGKPLHFRKITEIAIRENLLDHVGKIPEEVMAGQLAAHCRLPKIERRLIPVQAGTFALVEWGLDEDLAGLDNLIEPPPDLDLLYRGRERHPVPRTEAARGAGRERAREREREPARARRRDEAERHGKRYPPPAEVAYEILAGAGHALPLAEIAAQGAERLLMPDAFVRDQGSLAAALAEDNRRRESAGRSPLFAIDGDQVTLVAQPEPGERPVLAAARPAATATELRKAALAHLRRRLRACDPATFENVAAQLLEKLGLRELKVAKRGREHVIYTGRRRAGLADVRHCVRVLRTGVDASRRDVTELRRDIGHYGAQIGVVVTVGDAARDARGEAGAPGQLPILLLCGEALAEAFADHSLGAIAVVVPEVDEAFFQAAAEAGAREEAARRARREERERRDGGGREEGERPERDERVERPERPERPERTPRAKPAEPRAPEAGAEPAASGGEAAASEPPAPPEAASAPAPALVLAEGDEDDDEEGEGEPEADEAEAEGAAAEAGAPGEGKAAGEGRRRRRRRRRRGGRGRREAAAAAAGAAGGGAVPGAPAGAEAGPQPVAEAATPPDHAAPAPSPGSGPAAPVPAEPAEAPAPPPQKASPDSGEGGPTT